MLVLLYRVAYKNGTLIENINKIFNITTKEVIVTCVSTAVHGDVVR